ncbi:MAG TPA: hypothetical protein ENJ80_10665 [Gammaproteobacteria bacterium]|nr:hypothetical protein [Gammaproteobacteria bacterium]
MGGSLHKVGKLLLAVWLLHAAGYQPVTAAATDGSFTNDACIQCHAPRDPGLVDAWRASAHARAESRVDCVACHGESHTDAGPRARRDATCSACHGGPTAPVVHSYTTSKHGILLRLEKPDWTQPLAVANYRVPGCAYCHMHAGNHAAGAGVRDWNPLEDTAPGEQDRIQETMRAVCRECHSPRYINSLFSNGERMLSVARMKMREADALLEQAGAEFSADELISARVQMEHMQQHLKNVLLGIGHQSPDYQWWHGQPALDGDLLRIKAALAESRRRHSDRKNTEPTHAPVFKQRIEPGEGETQ